MPLSNFKKTLSYNEVAKFTNIQLDHDTDQLRIIAIDDEAYHWALPLIQMATTGPDLHKAMNDSYPFGELSSDIKFSINPDNLQYLYPMDPELDVMVILIKPDTKQFVLIYPHAFCVFGDASGELKTMRMD